MGNTCKVKYPHWKMFSPKLNTNGQSSRHEFRELKELQAEAQEAREHETQWRERMDPAAGSAQENGRREQKLPQS